MAMVASVEAVIRIQAMKFARAAGGSIDSDDLMQVGRMAALKSAATFDGDKAASFKTYSLKMITSAMKRECMVSRSSVRSNAGRAARDLSFESPIGDGEATVADIFADDAVSVDERLHSMQREAQVQAIVSKVRAEQNNPALFDALLERLTTTHFNAERNRTDGESLRSLGERYGVSRQTVLNVENKIRATLAVELASVA